MWLGLVVVVGLVVAVVLSIVSGGIFTIVLLPLAILAALAATASGVFGGLIRGGRGTSRSSRGHESAPLPHAAPSESDVPTTPEGLADARRAAQ